MFSDNCGIFKTRLRRFVKDFKVHYLVDLKFNHLYLVFEGSDLADTVPSPFGAKASNLLKGHCLLIGVNFY